MESTCPRRLIVDEKTGDPQPPQFRAFALPRISIADLSTCARLRRATVPEGGSNSTATAFARARARTYVHTHIYAHRVRIYTRDCIYAESYLPRLKRIGGGESRGMSTSGIASARAVIPSCYAALHHTSQSGHHLLPVAALRKRCVAAVAAVCRCIVSIFTQGRRAGGLLSFPRFSHAVRAPLSPFPFIVLGKDDLTHSHPRRLSTSGY